MVEGGGEGSVSDFPPIGDELRPKVKLKRHSAESEQMMPRSRQLPPPWREVGASTRIIQEAPSVPLAPVVSIRGYIPNSWTTNSQSKLRSAASLRPSSSWRLSRRPGIASRKTTWFRMAQEAKRPLRDDQASRQRGHLDAVMRGAKDRWVGGRRGASALRMDNGMRPARPTDPNS